jgi:hypothetical protein
MKLIYQELGGKVEFWVYETNSGEYVVESENNQMWVALNPVAALYKSINEIEQAHPRLRGKISRG